MDGVDGKRAESGESGDGKICAFQAVHVQRQAAEASVTLASITASDVIYDLGCGDARSARAIN